MAWSKPTLVALIALARACAAGSLPIRMNLVGYMPNAPKLATVEAGGCGGDWSVTNSTGNEVVLSGKTAELHTLERGHLCLVNFTALNATGEYRLNVGGIGHAADSFRIGPSALNKPFSMAMAGFYMARCGQATPALPESDELVTATGSGRKFEHKACHMDDGLIDAKHTHEPVDSHVNATGGWHDAGDYGKYSINTAFTVGVLMYGWEHFRSRMECMTLGLPAGEPRLPDYLDEVRWGVAWLLKMQRPDGFVYHKLTPSHFESFGDLSHEDRSARYMAPWSTAATADLAAVGAQCARVFAKFDSPLAGRCLSAARRAYEALQAHPDQQLPDLSGFGTGAYVIHDPWRESGLRMWAAIELYETTREVPFLADAEERLRSFDAPLEACLVKEQVEAGPRCKVAERMDWDEQRNLGVIRYLTLALGRDRDLRSPALVRELREHLAATVSMFVRAAQADPYGDTLGYTKWGVNGEFARQALLLYSAEKVLGANATIEATGLNTLSMLLGRNRWGRSFVTKLGSWPAAHPHHRPSMVFAESWPGLLVGGPNGGFSAWSDAWLAFRSNEIAINWNCGLVYATARYYQCAPPPSKLQHERTPRTRAPSLSKDKPAELADSQMAWLGDQERIAQVRAELERLSLAQAAAREEPAVLAAALVKDQADAVAEEEPPPPSRERRRRGREAAPPPSPSPSPPPAPPPQRGRHAKPSSTPVEKARAVEGSDSFAPYVELATAAAAAGSRGRRIARDVEAV